LRILLVLIVAGALSACTFALPRVHRITVQQGNVISQEMIDKLKPGMTRRQVAFIMGEPVMRDSFNPDRWDYVYSVLVPNVGTQKMQMSLFFENDVLAYFTGDLAPKRVTEAPAPGTAPKDDVGTPEPPVSGDSTG